MSANPTVPVTYGTVGGVPFTGNVNSATLASKLFVTLGGTPYVRNPPPGYPDPNPGVAISSSPTAYAQTIPGGTRLALYSDEAAALVAASAASYS